MLVKVTIEVSREPWETGTVPSNRTLVLRLTEFTYAVEQHIESVVGIPNRIPTHKGEAKLEIRGFPVEYPQPAEQKKQEEPMETKLVKIKKFTPQHAEEVRLQIAERYPRLKMKHIFGDLVAHLTSEIEVSLYPLFAEHGEVLYAWEARLYSSAPSRGINPDPVAAAGEALAAIEQFSLEKHAALVKVLALVKETAERP